MRSPGGSRLRLAWLSVGISALAVVTVLLVLVAFQINTVPPATLSQGAALPATGREANPSTDPIASPVATPSGAPIARTLDAQVFRMLDETYGYRAVRGTCAAGGALIERTIDGGLTWTRADLGSPPPQVIVALTVIGRDRTDSVVRRPGDCAPSVLSTFTGGEFWAEFPEALPTQLYVDPVRPTDVRSSMGTIASPCAGMVDVWPVPSGYVALCPGEVIAYSSVTSSWSTVMAGDVIAAAADAATGATLVLISDPAQCTGVLVTGFDAADPTPVPRSCIADDQIGDRATLALTGSWAWIWSGSGIASTDDGGVTWARVG